MISCISANLTSLPAPDVFTTRPVRALLLAHNQLKVTLRTFAGMHWLGRLGLSHNKLTHLDGGVFRDLRNLFELNLSYNQLVSIDQDVFTGLGSLRILNLHANNLVGLSVDDLSELTDLRRLILTDNHLEHVSEDAFLGLTNLKVINTDAYKFCCIAKHVEVCTPEADEFSSCEDLMANNALQVSIWVLGLCAFVGNAFVIIWRVITDRTKVASFLIINLGLSDLLMGAYMLIIASADVYYRGRYIMYADQWRASVGCQSAGILAMVSSEVSVFMLTAITADRMVSFLMPLQAGKFRLKHARYIAGVVWAGCVILSILPAMKIPYFGDAFFGRTGR